MARRRITAAALAAMLALGAAACGNDDDPEPTGGPDPTPTEQPTTEPDGHGIDADDGEVEPDDPYAIPDDIDEAYAEAVINEILVVRTEALALTVAANGEVSLPPDVPALVGDSHDGPERLAFIQELEALLSVTNIDEVFVSPAQMSAHDFDVLAVVEGSHNCLVVTGEYDQSGTLVTSGHETFYSVFSFSIRTSEDGANPTPWLLYDQTRLTLPDDESAPASREMVEAAELDSFSGIIEHTCEPNGDDA